MNSSVNLKLAIGCVLVAEGWAGANLRRRARSIPFHPERVVAALQLENTDEELEQVLRADDYLAEGIFECGAGWHCDRWDIRCVREPLVLRDAAIGDELQLRGGGASRPSPGGRSALAQSGRGIHIDWLMVGERVAVLAPVWLQYNCYFTLPSPITPTVIPTPNSQK
jgi:hypothetical protein